MLDAIVQSGQAAFETVYLDPDKIVFQYEGENLTFQDGSGTFYSRVTLRRCFPLSAQDENIMVRVPDEDMERGEEIGLVLDVNALEVESRDAVKRELRLHYFVPIIHRIVSIREEFGFLYWYVTTDRGDKEFTMRDSIIGSMRKVSDGRWLMIDINQTRYEIHDFDALDPISQKLLQRFLLL